MDLAACKQPPTTLPSSQSLHCSLLGGAAGWCHSTASNWQQAVPRRMPWIRQDQGLVNFTGVQRSRCGSASLAFKRHSENSDQEPSSKHFLSEEKMAARFNSLSLDNDHIYSSNGFPVQDEDPKWQQAYSRLQELQQRLSHDGANEETTSAEENEFDNVIVDGEFIMADGPPLMQPSLMPESLRGVIPEEAFFALKPSTEVVLWSPPGTSALHTIRTLMATPPCVGPPPQQKMEL